MFLKSVVCLACTTGLALLGCSGDPIQPEQSPRTGTTTSSLMLDNRGRGSDAYLSRINEDSIPLLVCILRIMS